MVLQTALGLVEHLLDECLQERWGKQAIETDHVC
jgi:hypothetical protein